MEGEDQETTQPFLLAELERMRSGPHGVTPRVVKVCLERFANFGNSGTPPGMISSWTQPWVHGVIGGGCTEVTARVSIADIGGSVAEPDAPRCGDLEHAPTRAWTAAAPVTAAAPAPAPVLAPTVEPTTFRPIDEDAGELEDELRAFQPSRARWIIAGLALLSTILTGLTILGSLEREGAPPPVPVRVIPAAEVLPDESDVKLEPPPPAERDPGATSPRNPAEDESSPEGDPSPKPRPKRKRKRKRKRLAKHETPECVEKRKQTAAAKRRVDWRSVERRAHDYSCWASAHEAKALRMEALFQQGKLEACLALGEGQSHTSIRLWTKRCRLARDEK